MVPGCLDYSGGHFGGDSELFFLGPRLCGCSLGQREWGQLLRGSWMAGTSPEKTHHRGGGKGLSISDKPLCPSVLLFKEPLGT